jgi:hypothetical protein
LKSAQASLDNRTGESGPVGSRGYGGAKEKGVKITLAMAVIGCVFIGCGSTSSGNGGDAGDSSGETVGGDTTGAPNDTVTEPDGSDVNPRADAPCIPDCAGKECGGDGCGGICGKCATPGCDENGQCIGGPLPPGACTNPVDMSKLEDNDLKAVAQTCAVDGQGDEQVTLACIKDAMGLSDDCVACFGGSVLCGMQCLDLCLPAPPDSGETEPVSSPEACDQCLKDKECTNTGFLEDFVKCSGLQG